MRTYIHIDQAVKLKLPITGYSALGNHRVLRLGDEHYMVTNHNAWSTNVPDHELFSDAGVYAGLCTHQERQQWVTEQAQRRALFAKLKAEFEPA